MEKKQAKVLVVAGPESSGKSTLAQALARHLGGHYVPELARNFMEGKPLPLSWQELETLYRKQVEAWQASLEFAGWVVWDTDGFNGMLWAKLAYGKRLDFLEEFWSLEPWDLALICSPDLPWEADPLREGPDGRWERFEYYTACYQATRKPFALVSGEGEPRFAMALKGIDDCLV